MQRNAIEPILGALVLVVAVAFLVFAYNKAGHRTYGGYTLTARFSSVDGLENGSDVRIGGVKVGQITSITIDPATYLAMVEFNLAPQVKVPTDSVASIASDGLLGGKYLGIEPGSSDDMLKAGQRVSRTEASVSLESLIGQFIYSSAGGSSSGAKDGGKGAAPSTGQNGAGQQPAGAQPGSAHP
ncbi:MAG TPA: outer membrane lipid asymmetry maintenance protein MlaD [Alphaproteobacteria bacterium]|jgi:phospholipid/cholesterol/gamma-HCH transport system substrate-binding protein|nr:outer membrane lipid asymmetry maintenance protein MlaD [Alphaproteobacteria bacterium]